MIGTPVSGTLFYIEWTHVRDVEGVIGSDPPATNGMGYVITADPSGSDVYDVAKAAVLNGKAKPEHQFALTHSKRLVEIKGRAIVASGGSN